ncbi:MAG TPA: diaminopimelate decarboxylase [Terriglobia bacterium]|nr:diaminopimelate decarboxylase [Terriglobia bacterium]
MAELSNYAFNYHAGVFCCEDLSLEDLAGRFGTPLYVYSESTILRNYEGLRGILGGISGLICYSVKASSNLRILSLLRRAGAGFDVVSGGELARALRAGAAPGSIVFSGVGKTREEIDAALAAGILMFNVESAGELEVIEDRARALQKVGRISMRVNPDVEADTHPYISTGQMIHKFGVPKDEAPELYRRAARSPHLKVHGVACHIGSQILDVEPFWKALDEILAVARSLAAEGIKVEVLDLGGGFGISYGPEPPLDLQQLARGLEARLGAASLRLIIEPGRALVGNAGALLTRVLYVKQNQRKNFVVVDAGMNDLMRPTLYGSYHEIVPVRDQAAKRLQADVVGPLCESGDFLAQDRDMPDVQPGDLLAVLTTGAYGFVLSSNYNTRPRPAEVLVRGTEAELIRARETVEDLWAGETP